MGVFDNIGKAARNAGKADGGGDLIRSLSAKRRKMYQPEFGGAKVPEDNTQKIVTMMLGGNADRATLRNVWSQLDTEGKARVVQGLAERFPNPRSDVGMSDEGQFILDFLTGRQEVSPDRLRLLNEAAQEAELGAMVGPTSGYSSPDAVVGTGDVGMVADDIVDDVGGAIIDPSEKLNRGAPNNPLRSNERFKQLAEEGIILDELSRKEPLRGPDTQVEFVVIPDENGGLRRVPVRSKVEGSGQLDSAARSQSSAAEAGRRPRETTDMQAEAGNTPPASRYDQDVIDIVFNGRGKNRDIFLGETANGGINTGLWGRTRGPKGPSDPRAAFASPREFAEFLASRMNPQAVLSKDPGLNAGDLRDLKRGLEGENVARSFENRPEMSIGEADRAAREAGMPRTPQQRLDRGMETVVNRLEELARERFGDTWGDEYKTLIDEGTGNLSGAEPVQSAPIMDVGDGIENLPTVDDLADGEMLVTNRGMFTEDDIAKAEIEDAKRAIDPELEPGIDPNKQYPAGGSFKEERAKKGAAPVTDWEATQRLEPTVGGEPATELDVAVGRDDLWTQKAPGELERMKRFGMIDKDTALPRSPDVIRAEIQRINESDLPDVEANELMAQLSDELRTALRISPQVHPAKKVTKGGKRGPGKKTLSEVEKAKKELGLGEGKPDSFGDVEPADPEGLFSREPDFAGGPDNLDELRDRGPYDDADMVESAPESSLPPEHEVIDAPDPEAEAAVNAAKSKAPEKAESTRPSEESADIPETPTTARTPKDTVEPEPTDLIVADQTLKGERIPGKQDSGRTVNGKVEPEKPKNGKDADIEAMEEHFDKESARMDAEEKARWDAENAAKKTDDAKPKDGDTPDPEGKKGSWKKKAGVGALVAGGLAGLTLLNKKGSPQNTGGSLMGGPIPGMGGGDGDMAANLVNDALLAEAADKGITGKDDAQIIRKLQRRNKYMNLSVNPNTQTHASWTE